MDDFATALDRLIAAWKANGDDVGEMVAELEGVVEGLKAELAEADEL